jgi:hypothetical protein
MGFPRQATRKEDQTLNETQGKHHVECRAADIPCKSTFNCQPGKVDLEEPAQEMQG